MSISDFLTLFSSRTQGFFWTSAPAPLLTGAALFSLSLSTLLACVWPSSHAERNLPVRGLSRSGYKVWPLWVWIYCLVWCVLCCPAPACQCLGNMLNRVHEGLRPLSSAVKSLLSAFQLACRTLSMINNWILMEHPWPVLAAGMGCQSQRW